MLEELSSARPLVAANACRIEAGDLDYGQARTDVAEHIRERFKANPRALERELGSQ